MLERINESNWNLFIVDAAATEAANRDSVSDNGLHMGEHSLMPDKMTAFDINIHVPLIVAGSGVPAARTMDEIVENIDLSPTFTELGGASAPANVDGRSLVPLLHGQEIPEWRTVALIEHRGLHKEPGDPDAPSARSGNPVSYEALRTRELLYVEYADGARITTTLRAIPPSCAIPSRPCQAQRRPR